MAKILILGSSHLQKFNLPRYSKHTLIRPRKRFPSERLPLETIWPAFESLATWRSVEKDYQLIHSFNSIPYTQTPWLVTYESILPTIWSTITGTGVEQFRKIIRRRLALDNCRKIIAMSDYAKKKFRHDHKSWHLLNDVEKKIEVIHPNTNLLTLEPKTYLDNKGLQLIFVGNHFARKGGIVALRIAKKAQTRGIPITMHLVSKMVYGSEVPTDFPEMTRYEEDLKSLNLNNVVFHGFLPNKEVIQLLSQSHFQIMATIHDTYGFSIIEGFSVATPAITTNVCALPEFVHHGENGYLLHLELGEDREWNPLMSAFSIKSDEYWDILDTTYNTLAEQALQLIVKFLDRVDRAEHYEMLSAGAIAQVQNVHKSQEINDLLDNIYLGNASIIS